MSSNQTILFVSLAANQTVFFDALGEVLEKEGFSIAHACFHDGAARMLREKQRLVFNPFDFHPAADVSPQDYGIDNVGMLLGHEKAAYQLNDTNALLKKFGRHLHAMDRIMHILLADRKRVTVVQELGGFTSVLAAYFSARNNGIDNWFIEPSFFKGRVFFTRNSFDAPVIHQTNVVPSEEFKEKLAQLTLQKIVVIPEKDKSHYRGAFNKLADKKNVLRLIQKLKAKYLNHEREEFHHIGGHVRRHVTMALNTLRLKKYYKKLNGLQSFLYYPLHVPADFALTIRSPAYLDQCALIDFLCRIAPIGSSIVIKEHPALVGAIDYRKIKELLRRHDNLVILSPEINNHEVLQACRAVVTINSKAGAEALLYGRPVISLGDSFYKRFNAVKQVSNLADLPDALSKVGADFYQHASVESFLCDVWCQSFPGELYSLSKANVEVFADSLQSCLRNRLT